MADAARDFTQALLRQGVLRADALLPQARPGLASSAPAQRQPSPALPARGLLSEEALLTAAAQHFGACRVDPTSPLPDPALVTALPVEQALAWGLVPWRRAGPVVLVATARPEEFHLRRAQLESALRAPVAMVIATAAGVEAALHARRGARIAARAEHRVADRESCRNFGGPGYALFWCLTCSLIGLWLWTAPGSFGAVLLGLALLVLVAGSGLKLAATIAALRPARALPPPATILALPRVSIIIGLYKESDIAGRLIKRLSRLDYPRDRLEVILAVEAGDTSTRQTLATTTLPEWMRVVVAPEGQIRTKPRALNVALDQCRGTIIGIYDAEDAPEPQQIRKVVDRFHRSDPEVACLQGALDYYNPHTNWMSRCFTLEYACWFRLILPGIARLGLVVPLGGTTLFFRRQVLEGIGGWDAHNVTEDADLGLRLFRHGYRTELIETTTFEEANCRPWPWVKQRSRWIKGYMVTWAVHMRAPGLLWRQLGARAFLALQVQFLGSILAALLAPLHLGFWLIALGLPTPFAAAAGMPLMLLYATAALIDIGAGWIALRRSGHRISPLWLLALHVYFPLACLAAYKALWELATRPFYWDKTSHGFFDKGILQQD